MKHTNITTPLILACALLLLPLQAMALRCGNSLINKGDPQAKVLQYCGEPVTVTRRFGIRPGVYIDGDARTGRYIPYGQREVLVEDWVLNFGPDKLMRQITFEDGLVVQVIELGYGFRD